MSKPELDDYQKVEQERLAREAERTAGRKNAMDMSPEEWKKAKASLPRERQKVRQLPDARTLSDTQFRRALGKINLAG